ncbi:flagellar basal body rod protein FlgC [bacterium]|nr:flagellar basal body rod protein FlgC [FCB group bacterium]MBL7191785.1 flagellar basal body rod protein FlgC [bacterium]
MNKAPYMTALDISASGLRAMRIRMNAIASNVANINTTRTDEGGPYRRQITVLSQEKGSAPFSDLLTAARLKLVTTKCCHLLPLKGGYEDRLVSGVEANVTLDNSPPKMVFDPSHPDADPSGYVAIPNINIVTEMVDMISASRSYEANVTAINAVKGMARKALEI